LVVKKFQPKIKNHSIFLDQNTNTVFTQIKIIAFLKEYPRNRQMQTAAKFSTIMMREMRKQFRCHKKDYPGYIAITRAWRPNRQNTAKTG
jgi:hypothetical protein